MRDRERISGSSNTDYKITVVETEISFNYNSVSKFSNSK